MNWEIVGAVGELVGALAVVATLAYFSIQIRETRRTTAANIYQDRALARAAAFREAALNNPNFYKILYKFETASRDQGWEKALEDLTDEERFSVRLWNHDFAIRLDNIVFQFRNGLIPESYYLDAEIAILQYAPLWRALGLMDPLPRDLVELIRVLEAGEGT